MASIPGVSERTYGRSRRMSTEPRPQDHAGDERKTEAEYINIDRFTTEVCELVINLDLQVQTTMLARADEVIE